MQYSEMEPSNQEVSTGSKRKRTPGPDDGRQSVPPLAQHSAGGVNVTQTQVSYLMRAKAERLRLIEGDSDTFADILGMIDDYEGVLQRHESLAANLGAKLVGPLLLKSFEKLFDGPITVVNASFALEQSPVSWLDIVTFARTNPLEFILSENHPGSKTCRFWIKGGQVEISEDDYRLIMSGAPERMIPTQPLPEDEAAELATLNILETRLAMLIKKADAVASKARQLNYHLKGRKTAVLSRKAAEQPHNPDPETRTFSPQPFSAVNPRPNGENIKIQQRLLDQYRSLERRPPTSHSRSKPTRVVATETAAPFVAYNGQEEPDTRRLSHPPASSEDGSEGQYRVLMASKIEKLSRGDPIHPPCDRCRRLRFDCTKHLTACQACTKKHAKCSWKDIKEGELEYVPLLAGGGQIRQGSEGVYGGRGGSWEGSLNLDPGLQSAAGVAGGAQQQQHSHPMMIARDGRDRDRERGDSEQAMLTQIAAAAAGR